LQAHSDISGRLLGFNAAGVTIIDAVRIQAKCREGEILVSKATFDDLPDDLKRRFNRPRPIKTKQHEKRAIEVRVLRRSSAG